MTNSEKLGQQCDEAKNQYIAASRLVAELELKLINAKQQKAKSRMKFLETVQELEKSMEDNN